MPVNNYSSRSAHKVQYSLYRFQTAHWVFLKNTANRVVFVRDNNGNPDTFNIIPNHSNDQGMAYLFTEHLFLSI
jgi:hypothetical protein